MPGISLSDLTLIHTEYRLPATVDPVQPPAASQADNEGASDGTPLEYPPHSRGRHKQGSRTRPGQPLTGRIAYHGHCMPTLPTNTASIQHFVRGTLGCKCPDAVFKAITISREQDPDTNTPYVRLVIGDRLLIYILDTRHTKKRSTAITALTTRGRTERDTAGLNRFRLVLASEHPTQAQAQASVTDAPGYDDRTHLHVIATDQLPDALRLA